MLQECSASCCCAKLHKIDSWRTCSDVCSWIAYLFVWFLSEKFKVMKVKENLSTNPRELQLRKNVNESSYLYPCRSLCKWNEALLPSVHTFTGAKKQWRLALLCHCFSSKVAAQSVLPQPAPRLSSPVHSSASDSAPFADKGRGRESGGSVNVF